MLLQARLKLATIALFVLLASLFGRNLFVGGGAARSDVGGVLLLLLAAAAKPPLFLSLVRGEVAKKH